MKIGIYGGTFNPIHHGHLINAELICDDYGLDLMFFVPVKQPVHKETDSSVTPEQRLGMVSLAVEGNPRLRASSFEIESDRDSYTIYTLDNFSKIYPDAFFYLIMGADAFEKIHEWKNIEKILERVSLIVMSRPGSKRLNRLIEPYPNRIFYADNPWIGISSSLIRKRLKNNRSIRYLVPEKVEKYIDEEGLYRK